MEFPGFKKITLESGITIESLKREAVEQQLLYISYERKWQSQIRALTLVPQGYKLYYWQHHIIINIISYYQLSS